jgi:hypothetical protein
MDLFLVRLARSPRPSADALRAALLAQSWLAPDPCCHGPWARAFGFPGGQVHVATKLGETSRYAAPGLHATLLPDASLETLAPRLVALAGELRLGIDTGGSNGALWWPAPDPATLEPGTLGRAIAVSRAGEAREAWPFLGFALAGPECLELAESHPALGFLLANTPRLEGRYRVDLPAAERVAFLRELARRPRRQILAALDFPATESMVRLLGKVPADRLNLESLRLLRDLRLAPHAAKALRHLPRFGSSLIPIVVRRKLWPHVGPQLLREVAEEADDGSVFFRLRDTVEMAEALGRLGEIGVVPTAAALEVLHERLRQEVEARPQRNLRETARREVALAREAAARPPRVTLALPPPRTAPPPPPPEPPCPLVPAPPPPPPGFVALRTSAELRKEGRDMQSCVGSYWSRVQRGQYAVFRVLEPERATLGLRFNRVRGAWWIDQLKGPANRPVRPETRLFVRDWVETGLVRPEAARWARERARLRHRDLLEQFQQARGPDERAALLKELARLRVGDPPGA